MRNVVGRYGFLSLCGALWLVFLVTDTHAHAQHESAVAPPHVPPPQSDSAGPRLAPVRTPGEQSVASRQHPIAAAESSARRPVDLGAKHIEVNVATQHVIAWEGDAQIFDFAATTGDDGSPTVLGQYQSADKIESGAYSELWGMTMPFWMGIYDVGDWEDGFHGLPTLDDGEVVWGDALGKSPATHGCIVLSLDDAKSLFDWAEVGTIVDVHG